MPVLNRKTDVIPKDSIYIGRGSKWGNPFKITSISDRRRVVGLYRRHLWTKIKAHHYSLEELASLHDKNLVCYCAPLMCHGDILLRAAAWARRLLDE